MREICVKREMVKADSIAEDFFQSDYLLQNNSISKSEILGLFRTIPLYVEMDKSEYLHIQAAEINDPSGNLIFNELKKEFYKLNEIDTL